MRLTTFIAPGDQAARAGEVRDGDVTAFAAAVSVRDLLAAGAPEPAGGERFRLEDVRLLAPVPRPGAIYGIGLNYADHVAETGAQPPEIPLVFTKVPTAVAPPGGPVRCPAVVRRLDYEGELAIVMGADGKVGGFAVADDISARDLQSREPQWTRAKGADTFCPYGPWITTPDEVPDPHALWLTTHVNGELRQDSSTANLIHGVDALISFLSETHTLEPGDLILTGTPGGVGMAMDPPQFLQPGDSVRIEIESLGAIEHSIEAA